MDANELAFWYWLTDVKGIGPVISQKLLDRFSGPLEIYQSTKDEIVERAGIRASLAENIEAAKRDIDRYIHLAKEQVELADRLGGRILTSADSFYRDIYKRYEGERALPAVIHVLGNEMLCLGAPKFAIVGTRRPSEQGRARTRDLAHNLAKEGVVIVSGLALGIDAEAHSGALEAGGKTIAILGCGADIRYPSANGKLYAKILEKGLIISEFTFGVRPSSENLRKRNRTIVAFSEGVVVAECPLRSGAMIAARFAVQQREPLFSFKYHGEVDNSGGEWLINHSLGAELRDVAYGSVIQATSQYISASNLNVDKIFQELWPKREKPKKGAEKLGKVKKKKADTIKTESSIAPDKALEGIQEELPLKTNALQERRTPAHSNQFDLKVGDWVMHPKFGRGEIVKIVAIHDDFQITIKFTPRKLHTFLWRYANLARV